MSSTAEEVQCARCGKAGPKITVPAYGGKLGDEIKAKICEPCWKLWMDESVKIINELRLNMANAEDRKKLTDAMRQFLKLPPPQD
jgi:Fe-S cluster biosynthesis and repair protein YggX